MLQFFSTYQYLSLALLMCLLAGGCLLAMPLQRRPLLLGGALCLPFALVSYDYIPEYWNPALTFHFITSPEDLLFSFSSGVMALFCVLLLMRQKPQQHAGRALALRRFFFWGLLGWGTAQLCGRLWLGPDGVMYSSLIGIAVVLLPLSWLRRSQAGILARGAGLFALQYVGIFALAHAVFPDWTEAWTSAAQLPWNLAWLPGFELAWGLAYGYCWPLFVFHVLELRTLEAIKSESKTNQDAQRAKPV